MRKRAAVAACVGIALWSVGAAVVACASSSQAVDTPAEKGGADSNSPTAPGSSTGVLPPPPVDQPDETAPDASVQDTSIPLAPPVPPTRYVLLGDFGFDDANEAAVAGLIRAWKPEFIVTLGDNSYPLSSAQTIDPTIGKYYSEYIYPYRGKFGPGATVNRFFACLGNHDWDSGNVDAHLDYFDLPGNERYWELRKGPVQFFCVDSDTREPDGTTPTSVQGQWLQRQLVAAKTPYRIVVFHHPSHSSGFHGSQTYMQWPFQAWGASAVYTGHDHNYERFDFGAGTIPYVVQGTGGADLRGVNTSRTGSVIAYSQKHGATFVVADEWYSDFVATTIGLDRIDEHVVASTAESARATDVLVPAGPVTRFFEGTPPANWATTSFDSNSWKSGAAPLGYGQGGEKTLLTSAVSHYFVKPFTLTNAAAYDHLVVWLKRDDGAALYLNGVEIGRSNLPDGPLTPQALARETVGYAAEATWVPTVVPMRLARVGQNVLAVELHQASATSSDATLDMRIEGKR
jgi:tartrate-resistant acid phosphatase type 5